MLILRATLLFALAATAQAQAPPPKDVPIPEKIPAPVSEESVPTVTIRATDNGDRVEEYRQAGKLYMVKITPKHGKPYYLYDDNRDGRFDRSDAEKNDISPVYWTIYEWN
jgi:hypothetical protein